MNSWLLTLFIDAVRGAVLGRKVIVSRYLDPILTIALGRPVEGSIKGITELGERSDLGGMRGGATGAFQVGSGQITQDAPGDWNPADRIYINAVLSRSGPFLYASLQDALLDCPAAEVLVSIRGALVKSIEQFQEDRIVRFTFQSRSNDELALYVTLFGHIGTAALESACRIIDGVQAKHFSIEGRKSVAAIPPFAAISADDLKAALEGQLLVAGLSKLLEDHFANENIGGKAAALLAFRNDIAAGSRRFFLQYSDKPSSSVPVPAHAENTIDKTKLIGPFAGAVQAAAAAGDLIVAQERLAFIERSLKPIRSSIRAKRILLDKLRAQETEAGRHMQVRREAELLAAYQSQIRAGSSEAELPDPYEQGILKKIEIDPSRSIHDQIKRRFKRAAKMKRSLSLLGRRIETVSREIKNLEEKCGAVVRSSNITHALKTIEEILKENNIPSRVKTATAVDKTGGYRKFDIDSTWFVLVGRNNKENDELTFHASAPGDYWFHAQNVPGSHIILKARGGKTKPPMKILHAAAAIAAHFSKARHSSIVPVIYTLRKYVRKPRKAPPGKVTCTREKTVFVEPGLPPSKPSNPLAP
jgi:hypothetical protein